MSLPENFLRLFKEKRFPEIIYIVRALWNREGWLYLKRNKNAVDRVKRAFFETFNRPPYAKNIDNSRWDREIAKYCDALGVKALIDDMRAAKRKGLTPLSILYFVFSKTGAPRWEMLLMQQIERERQSEKKKHMQELEDLAKLIHIDKRTDPEWVIQSRRAHKEISQRPARTRADRQKKIETLRTIEARLRNQGYSL